jgi:hypothetical protein
VGTVEVVVEAANNACTIRSPLLAVQKGSRAEVAVLKVSTRVDYNEEDVDWVVD